MERMLAVMADNPAAVVAGLVAVVCFATWPLFRARWTMLMAYVGNNLGFACTTLCSATGPPER
jgi:hypothetical protein